MKNLLTNKNLYFFAIFFLVFLLDRLSKFYILNLAESENVDIYINNYINFYLIWNKGVAFGLLSSDENYLYNIVTALIIIINLIIIYFIFITKDFRVYFFLIILGGSFGNLYDRLIYKAVPDFIDLHIGDFHWFIFNVADIFISLGVICLIFVEIFFNKNLNK
tara:strand:- start:1115 stop:1603 length:489 start_codon:yes stop_codon:yes gene_type:complete